MTLVVLRSCDGLSKEVSYETACCSEFLKCAIEDVIEVHEGIDKKDIVIALPEVKGDVLTEVMQWCEMYLLSTKHGSQGTKNIMPLLAADTHRVFEIIKAANFLDIGNLLDIGCKTAASQIPDMFPEGNERPTSQKELLELPIELFDMIFKQLPRYDYLYYVARLPHQSLYFAQKIEQELTMEMGNLGSTRISAAHDLRYIVDGWSADNAKFVINHCKIPKISSLPGWHFDNWAAPTFLTDGLHIILGSGFQKSSTSLVIFDVINTQTKLIQATELDGWPSDPMQEIRHAAFHSGLIIIEPRREPLRCFELSASTLNVTRLYPPTSFLSMCSSISQISISKEFICVLNNSLPGESSDLLVFGRGFVLKGCTKISHNISKLYIRGRTIVGLVGRNQSVEIWQVTDVNKRDISVTHSGSFSMTNQFPLPIQDADLGLSHNLDTFFATDGFSYYDNNKLIADFKPVMIGYGSLGAPKFSYPKVGCLDMLAAQYFTVYRFESTQDKTIIRFEISNARSQEKVKRVSIAIPKNDLGDFLGCQMFFTTIVLFFSSGIARLKLQDNQSIYKRVALNSSSFRGETPALEDRQDLPLEEYDE